MAKAHTLAPLLDALHQLMSWFENEQVSGIIIGGVAASLLGRPRLTHDVDALVSLEEERWPEFLSLAKQYDFGPRIRDPLQFAQKSRVLLLKHGASHIDVDIVFAALPFELESIRNATALEIEGLSVQLPRVEDFVIMKAVAARPKDLIDIESLIEAHPNLEYKRIRKVVREFADVLDMPDINENLENILAKADKNK